MLRIVESTPPFQAKPAANNDSSSANSSAPYAFTFEIIPLDPLHYTMKVQEECHFLACDITLEIREIPDSLEGTSVICHFPKVDDSQLNELIWEDETLYGIIMIRFQMNILEQLLLFCAEQSAGTLVIMVDRKLADELEIYRNFVTYERQIPTLKGQKTKMVIPTYQETYDYLLDFMHKVTEGFARTLWRDQRFNSAIRHYLKSHPLTEFK